MRLEYEPSSEPLHISAKQLLPRSTVEAVAASGGCHGSADGGGATTPNHTYLTERFR